MLSKFFGTTLSIIGFFGGLFCIIIFFSDIYAYSKELTQFLVITNTIGLIGSCSTLALGILLRIKGNKQMILEKQALEQQN